MGEIYLSHGNDQRVVCLCELLESADIEFRDFQVGGTESLRSPDRLAHHSYRFGLGLGDHLDRAGFALRLVDLCSLVSFGREDLGLLLAIGKVDFLLSLAF